MKRRTATKCVMDPANYKLVGNADCKQTFEEERLSSDPCHSIKAGVAAIYEGAEERKHLQSQAGIFQSYCLPQSSASHNCLACGS